MPARLAVALLPGAPAGDQLAASPNAPLCPSHCGVPTVPVGMWLTIGCATKLVVMVALPNPISSSALNP